MRCNHKLESQMNSPGARGEAKKGFGLELPSISNFIYRALDSDVSTGIVMGAAPMTIPVDTSNSSAL